MVDTLSLAALISRAGEAFRSEDWSAAEAYGERALRIDPDADEAARVVAASRFMREDRLGALAAWNRVGEPRVGELRVVGLDRTARETVTGALGLAEGRLLTPESLRRARRRVRALPSLARGRIAYRPRPEGSAEVVVATLERPLLFEGLPGVLATIARAYPGEELRIDLSSPLGRGEVLSGRWRWREKRPRVVGELAVPRLAGVPGVWRLRGEWERETFATSAGGDAGGRGEPAAGGGGEASPPELRLDRYRAAISVGRWARADLFWAAGLAVERWSEGGEYVSPSGTLEGRAAGDRLALRASGAWWSPTGGAEDVGSTETGAFTTGSLGGRWRSAIDRREIVLHARAGLSLASERAPLSVWPGAGTGQGRAHLLRAHPLIEDDVLRGPAFGRVLLHGGVEVRSWPLALGPLRLGPAGFVDAARAAARDPRSGSVFHVDAGAGVRVAVPGAGALRADLALGLRDGRTALSAAWEAAWPDW